MEKLAVTEEQNMPKYEKRYSETLGQNLRGNTRGKLIN